jgi:hypothetical protein
VASADSLAYLAEAVGKSPLPNAWRYGPSFEVRLRFRPRLGDIDGVGLSRRLDAIGIAGPLRADRLAAIAERRTLQPGDVMTSGPWRPRAFGFWRLDDGTALGVKIYASSRPAVDLLFAVPPHFMNAFAARLGFTYWTHLADRPEDLEGLSRLSAAILTTLRRAQAVAQLEAVHIQDQAWCDSLVPEDRGLVVPEAVAAACGWTSSPRTNRKGWVSIPLD